MAAADRGAETGEGGFRVGVVVALVLAAGLLFTFALYASLGQKRGRDLGDWRAPSSTGVTAVGLGALAELFRRLDRDVEDKAGVEGLEAAGAVLIVSDLSDELRLEEARYRFDHARAILLVLPKWRISWSSFGRRFAQEVGRIHPMRVQEAVVRAMSAGGAATFDDDPTVILQDGAFEAARNPIGATPLIEQAQLIPPHDRLSPVIAREDGAMLLAQMATDDAGLPPVYLLTDPDPLLNHGLDDGENALFAVRLMEWLGGTEAATIAFDDGPGAPTSPASFWLAMFQPPLVAVTLTIAALFGALGLIALTRFGRRSADRPGQAAGKDALLDAAAALLRQGDGDREVIRRFFDETLRDVGGKLQAPSVRERRPLIQWLEQLERARRTRLRVAALEAELDEIGAARPRPERLTALARDINAWREEMLRGHR